MIEPSQYEDFYPLQIRVTKVQLYYKRIKQGKEISMRRASEC